MIQLCRVCHAFVLYKASHEHMIRSIAMRSFFAIAMFVVVTAAGAPSSGAQEAAGQNAAVAATPKLSILYRFTGNDGAAPKGRLAADSSGTLYGTTESGGDLGSFCCGTVFRLAPPPSGQSKWKATVLYSFPYPGAQGIRPLNGLLLKRGELYGTTANRGATTSSACCGTVFVLSPPPSGQGGWKLKTLYTFKNEADGFGPAGDLVMDEDGALYGATNAGGKNNRGTIFKLAPPKSGQTRWTKTILYHFKGGTDGAFVRSGLTFDSKGALYGVATQDGSVQASCCGTIFKLSPPPKGQTAWKYEQLYRFKGGDDGSHPEGRLLIDQAGALFGTTMNGGEDNFGTLFKLTPPKPGQSKWSKAILHDFRSTGADGNFPSGGLARDGAGNLYGVTQEGGGEGAGTIFKLTKNGSKWSYKVLRSLTHQQAVKPYAGLIQRQGALFGTTIGDNAFDRYGTVFELE